MFYDHPIHLGLLAGPDYSTSLVSVTNPELVRKAEKTAAPGYEVHGFRTVKDIMDAMNPLTGKIYLESIEYTRIGRIMCMLMYGKYPHPSTLAPGGLQTTISTSSFNEFYTQLGKIFDYCKVMIATWDDMMDFFLESNPAYEQVGARDKPHPDRHLGRHRRLRRHLRQLQHVGQPALGQARHDHRRQAGHHHLTDINMGYEEFVDHSFYDDWTRSGSQRFATDPLGNPISPYHPWNKETIPRPSATNFKEKYTWDTAPRWDRKTVETGTYGRMWTTALAARRPTTPSSRPPVTGCASCSPATTSPRPRCSGRCPAPSTPWSATGPGPTPWASPPPSG